MFGDGIVPGRWPGRAGLRPLRGGSDPDVAGRRRELRGDQARVAVGADPLDLDVLERALDRTAEPLADAVGVAGDLERGQVQVAAGALARVVVAVALPADEEGQLRVGL